MHPEDNNCEVGLAATELDIEWKGVQAEIKSKHVTMGFGLAHRSSELNAMRMEDLSAIAPLDGDRDHWKAILNAVREVNIQWHYKPLSVKSFLRQTRENAMRRHRRQLDEKIADGWNDNELDETPNEGGNPFSTGGKGKGRVGGVWNVRTLGWNMRCCARLRGCDAGLRCAAAFNVCRPRMLPLPLPVVKSDRHGTPFHAYQQ